MTMKPLAVSAILATITAVPALAQNNPAVAQAMFSQASGKYRAPACSADKGKQFKVSSGYTYLKSAIEGKQDPAPLLGSANRVITEAITQDDQGKSASAWYGLGWVDLFQGDVAGADTALAKAEALAPDCKDEIDKLRRIAYAPMANAGVESMQRNDTTAALKAFQQAYRLRPGAGFAPYNIGVIYSDRGQTDSAIAYFAKAAASTGTDSNDVKLRNRATYAQAAMLINSGKGAEAVPLLENYLKTNPGDQDAQRALAKAYRAAGQTDKAQALDAKTGTTSAASPTANTGLGAANKLYQDKDYAGALAALKPVLAAEPTNVSALQLQANAYLATQDGAGLAQTGGQWAALEPLSKDALRMEREGYRLSKQMDKANATAEKILTLPANVTITELTIKAASAVLGGRATGLAAMDPKTAKPIAPAPFTLVFEMLDKSGKAVATQEVAFEALAPDATKDFSFEAKGEGISSYRYTVKK